MIEAIKKLTLKVIKTSTYNDLLKNKAEVESLRTQLFLQRQSTEEQRRELLLNCRIRKCIIGRKGIGKTTFLKNKILPQLSNYFVIDTTGEYKYLPKENTYYVDREEASPITHMQNVISSIKKNAGKTIILEEPGMFMFNHQWYWDLIKDGNFIIICQSIRSVQPILYGIDAIIGLGDVEFNGRVEFNAQNNQNKFVTIGKVTF